jgi:hypothetical protein
MRVGSNVMVEVEEADMKSGRLDVDAHAVI